MLTDRRIAAQFAQPKRVAFRYDFAGTNVKFPCIINNLNGLLARTLYLAKLLQYKQ